MSIDNEERKKRCAEAMRVHGDAVYRLAFARCRNTPDAEDIFQTTFLRFYASPISFGNPEHEKAWLLRVCINACKDLQKSAWRTKVSAMPDEFDAPDTSARKETTPQEEALDEAMQGLSPLTSCGSISGHLVTIPYQIIKHIPTSALLEA